MFELKSFITRISVVDVLIFVNIYIKSNYNKHHKFIFFKKENEAYLRFHKNYNIFINAFIITKLK